MMGTIGQDGRSGCRALALVVVGLLIVLSHPRTSEGSPMRNRPAAARLAQARAAAAQARNQSIVNNDRYWRQALRQGWTTQVRVPGGTRLSLQSNGLLPDTAFVTYLRWRQAINPQTFNTRHPNVAQLLLQDQVARQTILNPQTVAPTVPSITPPTVVVPPAVGPEVIVTPPAVPEPASVLVLGTLFAAAAWARSRKRRLLP